MLAIDIFCGRHIPSFGLPPSHLKLDVVHPPPPEVGIGLPPKRASAIANT